MFRKEKNMLVYEYDSEILWIRAWGENALRIQATKIKEMPNENWALLDQDDMDVKIIIKEKEATILNGKIRATISKRGKLMIYNQENKLILEEYARNQNDLLDEKCSSLMIQAREFKPNIGGDYNLIMRFESLDKDEKIYGMGQYQQSFLNLKGIDLELAQRNSQASVPFAISSRGYGFLWNNPSVGRAIFGKNIMSFEAQSTKALDYWVVVGDTPAEIEEGYATVTGKVPMMPEYGLGFWQCKLRYQTQEELLHIAREYRRRQLPIDLIVIDYFHWPMQGDWKFDSTYWPDPEGMIKELQELNIELMISFWPTVDKRSERYNEMIEKGYLIRNERGFRIGMEFQGVTINYDATNPDARDYVWQSVKQNYYDKGIKVFWLDEAEPGCTVYDFDNYRYQLGSALEVGNIYPREYARGFYEGQDAAGQKNIVNLLRCAWAGSQKYGALVWSGDIASSYSSMRNQLAAGLNMGIAGIPWWTTDIGGFHGGNPNDEKFRELFARWFQWGTFCPVMRLHGDREPKQPQHGTTGGATCRSGADNEVWSYGERIYEVCKKYMMMRDNMRDYTRILMKEAHEKGTPIMRTLFYEFPEQSICWEIEDQYMYGSEILVAPILFPNQVIRKLYLPDNHNWTEWDTGKEYAGGQWVEVNAPIESIPVFMKDGFKIGNK
ncbi:MAG: glycoside hydrolase family 31 protein [Eubacteriales bacterium]